MRTDKAQPTNPATRSRWLAWLAWATVVSMFIGNTIGFTDAVTGSALGCGPEWPRCNGRWIPDHWETATIIEYAHRVSILFTSVGLLPLGVWAWWRHRQDRVVRVLLWGTLGGVIAESVLGALTVLFSNPPALIAVHLGVALTAFVSLFLLAVVLSPGGAGRHRAAGVAREQEHGTTDVPFRGQQAAAGVAREQEPETVPRARGTGDPAMARAFEGTRRQNTGRALQRLSWVVAVYVYVASYIGAYVASTGYGALFSGWPLPTERPDVVGVAFWVDVLHRVAALGFVGLAGALVVMARREAMVRPDVYRASVAMLGLVGLQALSGALLIATHIRVWAFLLHVTIVTGLFVDAGYLVLRTTTTGRREAVRPEAVEDGATAVTPDMV